MMGQISFANTPVGGWADEGLGQFSETAIGSVVDLCPSRLVRSSDILEQGNGPHLFLIVLDDKEHQIFIVVGEIHMECHPELFEIGGAAAGTRPLTGRIQGREKHSGKDRDDRDHDEELYQCKTAIRFTLQI